MLLFCLVMSWALDLAMSLDSVTFSVIEELQVGSYIGNIKTEARLEEEYAAEDLDSLRFTILPPDNEDVVSGSQFFQIVEDSGIITVSSVVDRDHVSLCAYQTTCQLAFEVAVGPALYFKVINVYVDILDINDNSPTFSKTEFTLNISESALPNTMYNLPSVADVDSSDHGITRFDLRPNNGQFNVTWSRDLQGRVQPRLELRKMVDREQMHVFDVTVIAYDSGSPPNSASLLVHIQIQDANDNDPVFHLPTYETRLTEDAPIGTPVITIRAEDPDLGPRGHVQYSLGPQSLGQSDVTEFRIDPDSGVVYLQEMLDRETKSVYYLSVVAMDQGKEQRQASTSVTVHVDDVNDNSPVIRISVITESGRPEVLESADVGTFVALVSVTDRDSGPNAEVSCDLNSDRFAMQTMEPTNKFKIVTKTELDREDRGTYDLVVECEDQGPEPQVSRQTISVYVTDINDNAPVFSQAEYVTNIDENNDIGVSVLQLECTDRDSGPNAHLTFTLLDNNSGDFMIESTTGIIRASHTLDYETMKEARLRVQARDNGTPSLSATCVVMVHVNDVNDQPPVFVETAYTFVVLENQLDYTSLGRVVASDKDSDSNSRFWYRLESSTAGGLNRFRINRENGSLTLLKPLDREIEPFYHLTVTATNFEPPGLSATASVTIYVQDVNDNTPVIDFPTPFNNTVHVSSRLPPGYKVTQIRAHDPDTAENADLSYFLIQDPSAEPTFGIDPKSGEIFLNHDMSDVETQTYRLQILVKDGGVPEKTTTTNITVVMDKALPVPSGGPGYVSGSPSPDSDGNMRIIIIVVATSGVVIIVLLASIVFVLLSSRRKTRLPESLVPPSVVLDNMESPQNNLNTSFSPDSETALRSKSSGSSDTGLDFSRYVPLASTKASSQSDRSKSPCAQPPPAAAYPPTALPPRGVYVKWNQTPLDSSFVSDDSDRTRQELQALASSPYPVWPVSQPGTCPAEDRHSASSSTEDSVTDSGRGASEEGDPTSGDERGGPRSAPRSSARHPPPRPPRKELVLSPEYGLKELQTQFDPHYKIKYNNLDQTSARGSPYGRMYLQSPDVVNIRPDTCAASSPAPSGPTAPKQTVRNVKAKDRFKKVDPAPTSGKYKPDLDDSRSTLAGYNFSDANSLMNYKGSSTSALSEITDATSETSATSGSYIIDHEDDPRTDTGVTMVTGLTSASHC